MSYEPEQFPGLIAEVGERERLLLFASGSFVLVGLRFYPNRDEVHGFAMKALAPLGD